LAGAVRPGPFTVPHDSAAEHRDGRRRRGAPPRAHLVRQVYSQGAGHRSDTGREHGHSSERDGPQLEARPLIISYTSSDSKKSRALATSWIDSPSPAQCETKPSRSPWSESRT